MQLATYFIIKLSLIHVAKIQHVLFFYSFFGLSIHERGVLDSTQCWFHSEAVGKLKKEEKKQEVAASLTKANFLKEGLHQQFKVREIEDSNELCDESLFDSPPKIFGKNFGLTKHCKKGQFPPAQHSFSISLFFFLVLSKFFQG